MRLLILTLTAVGLFTSVSRPALSQCCLGAQHVFSESKGGRFRVEGHSLTGTGPSAHGPYHFRFRFLERRNAGEFRELHRFELKWDLKDHFTMRLMVSPTGNGFAVLFPYEQLTFYSCDGRETYRFPEARDFEPNEDGYNVKVIEVVYFAWQGLGVEDSNVFLPLGTATTKMLDYQAIWYLFANPEQMSGDLVRISELLNELEHGNGSAREEAADALLRYGATAIPELKKASSATSDRVFRDRLDSLIKQLAPWESVSGPEGWRDLSLIAALLYYPDSEIGKQARFRLEDLLEGEFDNKTVRELHDWVVENRDALVWDPDSKKYVPN